MTTKRIHYGAVAIANCNGAPIVGVKSVGVSFSRSVNSVYERGKDTPAATYAQIPDIELTYSRHVTYGGGMTGFDTEPGLDDFVGFDVIIGEETDKFLEHPSNGMRFPKMLLSNVTYNMSVDQPISVDRTYRGWTRASPNELIPVANESEAIVLFRPGVISINAPNIPSNSVIQSVRASMSINRSIVGEFATRKPYASYITFPIEISCVIETLITTSLGNFNFDLLETACKNGPQFKGTVSISACGGNQPISIPEAYLTAYNYSGAEARKDSDSFKMSLTYTSFKPPRKLNPVNKLDNFINDC